VEAKKYSVRLTVESKKTLSSLAKRDQIQISCKLIELENNPFKDAKKLKNTEYWRIRTGDFRIIYTIDKGVLIVLVIRIGLRKDVCRKL
jgi:mRNA interferase RelE/StbE